ncbi:hypothetical protein TNCV_1895461 [Trichonephila clavipes]|nr:hypothetical protein TNCV_1895461 [Trichonephila clavipes]
MFSDGKQSVKDKVGVDRDVLRRNKSITGCVGIPRTAVHQVLPQTFLQSGYMLRQIPLMSWKIYQKIFLHAEIVEVEIEVVSPSIVSSGNFAELNHTVTCILLKANDRRTSCPCHDEFRGPRSDYVRQVALENNKQQPPTNVFDFVCSTPHYKFDTS